ncbi:hypothetical protein [Adlercreutzia sp. ZJ138]|uniref:hypothetical protein n=1 Tax=Adlercreutzia sp. ZJ138 TaxID=2709405 RepID=UPI0013EB4A43|nr:hypothetical protein [Adlercreutzia sp. ZJ138]
MLGARMIPGEIVLRIPRTCEFVDSRYLLVLLRRLGNKCIHRDVELTDEAMLKLDIKRENTVYLIVFLSQVAFVVRGISGRPTRYVCVTVRIDKEA